MTTAVPSRQLRQYSAKFFQTTNVFGLALPYDEHAVTLLA